MQKAEFSYGVAVSSLPADGLEVTLEASPDERAALAARFDLIELAAFTAALRLTRVRGGPVLHLGGRILACVVQRCVVTLEPVTSEIDAPVDIELRPAASLGEDVASDEDVEPYEGDLVDLGEIAAQELALSLDPYPRSPAAGPRGTALMSDDAPQPGPFAVLARLRGRK